MLHDNHRVRAGLDVWVVPDFAQDTLERNPGTLLDEVYSNYPHRGKGDDIVPGAVQWVDGDNDALRIRGHPLKRQKMWLQTSPTQQGYSRYNYTGWQWRVLPATGCVDECEEVGEILPAYNAWLDALGEGHEEANHAILTAYPDGNFYIGQHHDKTADIHPNSLIVVVKLGRVGRPFEICDRGESKPFYSQVLTPGTAVIMTLAANALVTHGVPASPEQEGLTGSIVFRTIRTVVSVAETEKKIRASERTREREADHKRELEEANGGEPPKKIKLGAAAHRVFLDAQGLWHGCLNMY